MGVTVMTDCNMGAKIRIFPNMGMEIPNVGIDFPNMGIDFPNMRQNIPFYGLFLYHCFTVLTKRPGL